MKNQHFTISIVLFVSILSANCANSTDSSNNSSNLSTELNFNKSNASKDNTDTADSKSDDSKENEVFELTGKWKHVSSRLNSTMKPVFIRDHDIYFTFNENGKGVYTKTFKGLEAKPADSTEFKWKWKDDETLILDKVRDEILEFKINDKGPRHLELKNTDKLGMLVLLQKPIE